MSNGKPDSYDNLGEVLGPILKKLDDTTGGVEGVTQRHEELRQAGVLIGGVHRPAPVAQQPEVSLRRWQVFRLKRTGTVHFYGFDDIRCEGRVSSPILQYDPKTRIGVSRSGRRYELQEGREGFDRDALYVFDTWLRVQHLTDADITPITEEYE